MANILLVEPSYRSKFPPLGLLRIGTYHKMRGDSVTFVRGRDAERRKRDWHRVYVSSLFTYELPRTVETAKYYLKCVPTSNDLIIGGIGATLLPQYIADRVAARVITGRLDRGGELDPDSPPISGLVPDYSLLTTVDYEYQPEDAYFCRATTGCIRNCKFCAVPRLEPDFAYGDCLHEQISHVRSNYGEKRDLVLLDNNVLAVEEFDRIVDEIVACGFGRGAKLGNRRRNVDFNQGIDARLVTAKKARQLARLPLSPVRLAFDRDAVAKSYEKAIRLLRAEGFRHYTNYVLFNFQDDPASLYRRLSLNYELGERLDVRVTAFPMKYVPISDVDRRHIGKHWRWRYLRGIQCVLIATHGMISPNQEFFGAAFGNSFEEFLEILTMPDDYIIHRADHADAGAREWREAYHALSPAEKEQFVELLDELHVGDSMTVLPPRRRKYSDLLRHY